MIMILGALAGALSDRVGSRGICSLSALVGCVAFFFLSMLGVESSQTVFAGMPEEAAAHTLAAGMLVPGFHSAFLVGVVCCIIALVLSLAAKDRLSDASIKI